MYFKIKNRQADEFTTCISSYSEETTIENLSAF